MSPRAPNFPARAKSVIWLFMNGGPSQVDTFDYKPEMNNWFDKDLPDSIRQGQRLLHEGTLRPTGLRTSRHALASIDQGAHERPGIELQQIVDPFTDSHVAHRDPELPVADHLDLEGDLVVGLLERLLGVVGRHHDDDTRPAAHLRLRTVGRTAGV